MAYLAVFAAQFLAKCGAEFHQLPEGQQKDLHRAITHPGRRQLRRLCLCYCCRYCCRQEITSQIVLAPLFTATGKVEFSTGKRQAPQGRDYIAGLGLLAIDGCPDSRKDITRFRTFSSRTTRTDADQITTGFKRHDSKCVIPRCIMRVRQFRVPLFSAAEGNCLKQSLQPSWIRQHVAPRGATEGYSASPDLSLGPKTEVFLYRHHRAAPGPLISAPAPRSIPCA